jgi:cytochrome c
MGHAALDEYDRRLRCNPLVAGGQPQLLQFVVLQIIRPVINANRKGDRMKTRLLPIIAALLGTTALPAMAQLELAQKKNCLACHSVDKKVVGPAYKDVAAKYAGDKDAVAKLTQKVLKGGVGVWGQIPMPANPQVNEAEAKQLVTWILGLK